MPLSERQQEILKRWTDEGRDAMDRLMDEAKAQESQASFYWEDTKHD